MTSHSASSSSEPPLDKQSLDYVFRTGLAGGIAGCAAKTAVAPLDRVKILFQASNPEFQKYAGSWKGVIQAVKSIHSESGALGLLQGHSATLLRVFPYAAIKFMAYEQMHHILMPTKDRETPGRRFIAGSVSGATSVFFTYPLEVLRVRLAFQTVGNTPSSSSSSGSGKTPRLRPSLQRAISTIYHEGSGIAGTASTSGPRPSKSSLVISYFPILKFYRGFSVTLLGIIPYAGTSFLVYGSLRSLASTPPFRKYTTSNPPDASGKKPRTTPITDLVLGAVSGAISQTVSYPFEIVRRRMQVGGLVRPGAWLGWRETTSAIWQKNGWRGFFVGLTIGYVKVVPMTAISFMVWEEMKLVLGV